MGRAGVLPGMLLALVFSFGPAGRAEGLRSSDISFSGPLGSEGATVEQTGPETFRILLGHAPGHPDWANLPQLRILRGARGTAPRLDFVFRHDSPRYLFDDYFVSFSCDGRTWRPLQWLLPKNGRENSLQLPRLDCDSIEIGYQVPLSFRELARMVRKWSEHPCVTVEETGRSAGRLPVWRIRITDPQSPVPPERRRVHYVGNEHPGEHNARWRMAGMIEWLLSDEAAEARRCSIFYFTPVMSPDSIAKGWYRVNSEGVDMNRSYRVAGADADAQAHEAFVRQRALEELMASSTPVDTVWAMHTWQGIVEPLLCGRGPELQGSPDAWEGLRDCIRRHDSRGLLKPLALRDAKPDGATWNWGPHLQFGVTTVLVEGGGGLLTEEENRASGEALVRGIVEFYSGPKPEREGRR